MAKTIFINHLSNRPDRLDSAVQELLEGKRPEMPRPQDVKLDELSFRLQILTRAIPLQEKQIATLRGTLSKEICESVTGEYSRIVDRSIQAAQVLLEAVKDEADFRDSLADGGISLAHLPTATLFNARHRLTWFIEEAQKSGYKGV